MAPEVKFGPDVLGRLQCPICKAALRMEGDRFHCEAPGCQAEFPVVDGIPVLINEANSLFTTGDFVKGRETYFRRPPSRVKRTLVKALSILPKLSANVGARANYRRLRDLLFQKVPHPLALIIGGGIVGLGMREFLSSPSMRFVETDVSLMPRTALICDSHDLPFEDATFDVVVAQAVLEHVVDPYRCVEEMHRVLKPAGLVYAETAFMQPVHGGKYDFMRFTYLGHRRLFRHFEMIDAGAVCGPGMALAYAYHHFLLSFFTSKWGRRLAGTFAQCTAWMLKYADYYLIRKPSALYGASQLYFMGRKSQTTLPDRDLLDLFWEPQDSRSGGA